jgi:hypothetical protein
VGPGGAPLLWSAGVIANNAQSDVSDRWVASEVGVSAREAEVLAALVAANNSAVLGLMRRFSPTVTLVHRERGTSEYEMALGVSAVA